MSSLIIKKTQEGLAQSFLNTLLKPHWIVFFTVSVSALAWLTPDFFGYYKGFKVAESMNLLSLLFIFTWYFLAIFICWVGFSLGNKFPKIKEADQYASLDKAHIYRWYSVIALIGIFYTIYVTFKVLGFYGFFYAIITFTTNKIAYAIYQDYSAGIFSLRYVIIIAFGWALYRVIILKKIQLIDILNIGVFIFYIAFFGRRLQLVCSILVFLTLANRYNSLFKKVKLNRFYWLVFFGFIMLSVATLLRNYGSYAEMGYSNPLSAVLANVIAYLAAPFQVSLGVGNNVLDAFSGVGYRSFTEVDTTLTANSAFAEMVTSQGTRAIMKVNAWALFFGFMSGWLYKNKENYLYTGYPIILYAFAELWRIDLFDKGIFYTLLIAAIGIPIIHTFVMFMFTSKKQ
ncbi:hypothetical protein WJR50_09520 [Catalinimonas sp. 4WD22]|uniref:hypothetical protein n=1 Tax=Catalinimonas locisalis TaxID=3133978 RepID=UPI003100D6AB